MADRIDPKPGEILFDPACGTGGFLTCAIRHMRERYVKKLGGRAADAAGACAPSRRSSSRTCSASPTCCSTASRTPASSATTTPWPGPTSATARATAWTSSLTNPPFGGREEDGIETNFPKHFQTRETADLFLALIIRLLKPDGRAAVVLPDGSLFGEGVKTRLKEHLLEECNLHTIVRLPNSVFKPYASIGTNLLFFEKGEPTKEIWFYEHRVPEGQKAYSMTKPIRFEHLKPCVDWWGGAKRKARKETEVAWNVTADEVKARGYNLDFKNPHTVADDHGDPEELLAKLDEAEKQAADAPRPAQGHSGRGAAAMNPAQLLAHFDRISEAPDAVPRLRRFILDLAVRGKLVEQDPNDEPASELLKRIEREKQRLLVSGQIRNAGPIERADGELAFPSSSLAGRLPHGIPRTEAWRWQHTARWQDRLPSRGCSVHPIAERVRQRSSPE